MNIKEKLVNPVCFHVRFDEQKITEKYDSTEYELILLKWWKLSKACSSMFSYLEVKDDYFLGYRKGNSCIKVSWYASGEKDRRSMRELPVYSIQAPTT